MRTAHLPLRDLQDAEFVNLVAAGPLLQRKHAGEDVAEEWAALDRELAEIQAALRGHPEMAWKWELIERARLR